jgi:hypothetical protein
MAFHQSAIWPIHPQPIEGEVLSSWVSRIGSAADLSLLQFRKLCLPKKRGQGVDLDQFDDSDFFEALASGIWHLAPAYPWRKRGKRGTHRTRGVSTLGESLTTWNGLRRERSAVFPNAHRPFPSALPV